MMFRVIVVGVAVPFWTGIGFVVVRVVLLPAVR
jgi:hypothetical protein